MAVCGRGLRPRWNIFILYHLQDAGTSGEIPFFILNLFGETSPYRLDQEY